MANTVAFGRTGAIAPVPFAVRWLAHDWCCGYCLAVEMTRYEYRTHLATWHNVTPRGTLPLALIPR